jgi:hypothetical protein
MTDELMTVIDPRALFEQALPDRGQLLAVPLANAVTNFVRDRAQQFVATDQFKAVWEAAVRVAHQNAVRVLKDETPFISTSNGQVTFNLLPAISDVLQQLSSSSPQIFGRQVTIPQITIDEVPASAIARLEQTFGIQLRDGFGQFTVYDNGKLHTVQQSVRWFDAIVVWLIPFAIVLAGVALWLSYRRRRTLLQLAVGVALGMVLIRRVGFRLQDQVAALPPTQLGRDAVGTAVAQFLDPLRTFALWTLLVALLTVAVAVLTADYAWAVSLRHRTGAVSSRVLATTSARAHDDSTVAWVRANRNVLLWAGGGVAFAILWLADLSWIGLLLVLVLVAAYELVVYRMAAPLTEPSQAA